MKNENLYTYKPTLGKPITYQYSKFNGMDFVSSYAIYRLNILKKLKISKQSKDLLGYGKSSEYAKKDFDMLFKKFESLENTKEKLSLMLFMQHKYLRKKNKVQKYCCNILSKFIRKYEVSKKIYLKYDSNLMKISHNYSDMTNYLLLSANLAIYYQYSKNLKFLNAFIKINDLLCSEFQKIRKNNYDLLHFSLNLEINAIKKLYLKRGIKIEA